MLQSRFLIIFCFTLFISFWSCKEKEGVKNEHAFTNDLINETSPYLLQHSHNPVDWRPWSQEALDVAAKENKLVLVSVGYSSCHWCHVMEEESFEDLEVAELMNANFINIKVDREERPDVDHIYMTALQLLKGSGGWPLNVITLPNGKPIYGGTYHTKEQWIRVLTDIANRYKADPEEANAYADRLAKGIEEVNTIRPINDFENLTKSTLENSIALWKKDWDLQLGGNKGSQKFMLPLNLSFLLDYAEIANDVQAKTFVKTTLDKMALGGIYDHIGGGFYRYSTDASWKVPHFEKMLYDNAQLVSLYSKAYSIFKDERYKKVVVETLDFLEREMKHTEGGYYAALDADSEGEEGKFYVWELEELKSVLKTDFPLFKAFYKIAPNQVWENGTYIIHESTNRPDFAKIHNLSVSELNENISKWKALLLTARGSRIAPRKDDKLITSWNALLISGFIDAYKVFGNREYLDRALSSFTSVTNLKSNGELVHTYKDGKSVEGFLEDYAFLTKAALDIYLVTLDPTYLNIAQRLNTKIQKDFLDPDSGLYRYNSEAKLISKILKVDDGVIPSPNAVVANNLFKLGHIMYDIELLKKAKGMLSSVVPHLEKNAFNYSEWNALFLKTVYPYFEVAVVGEDAKALVAQLNTHDLPNSLVLGSTEASELPLFKSRFVENETFIYVCKESTCKLPVTTVNEALEQLSSFKLSAH